MTDWLSEEELRSRSAEMLRRVQNGTTYEITSHGDVVAVLMPAGQPAQTGLRIRRAVRQRPTRIR